MESFVALHDNGWVTDSDFDNMIAFATLSGKDGLVSLSALELTKDSALFSQLNNQGDIEKAMLKLRLPAQAEAHCGLQLAQEEWLGEKSDCVTPYNHPINWTVLEQFGAEPTATLRTTAGNIEISLDPIQSPSACASFIGLAQQGFYDNKRFHRVVPSFVIQAGCPNGDGYGSVDYTIRSDFGLHDYRAGAVGMASIGKDTESCQWFITHNHTPHLEGRYTIFAYVTSGMDVVQRVTMEDRIVSITIHTN